MTCTGKGHSPCSCCLGAVCLSDHLLHVYGTGGQDGGVLELNIMALVNAVFRHSSSVLMLQTDVVLVLL
jgi:tRNA(Arg) A34 adenosine deaminase TadA